MDKNQLMKLTQTALMAALCFVVFTFLQIKIPTPGGGATSIHLGNAMCVLAALLLGGLPGGVAGAVGMGLADLMDPVYITYAPKTILLKFCMGLIAGYMAHHIAHVSKHSDKAYLTKWSFMACLGAFSFNVVMDPLAGYFYKRYLLGMPQEAAEILAKMTSVTTFINAILSTILVVLLYRLLKPTLDRAELHIEIEK